MRDIFFEDEIDYFRETVESILMKFIQYNQNQCIPGTNFLHEFKREIHEGMNDNLLMEKILNIRELIVKYEKDQLVKLAKLKRQFGIRHDDHQIESELQEFRSVMDNPQLNQLISTLSKLVNAAKNKSRYLEQHQEELKELEKDEYQQCNWAGDSRLLLAIDRENTDKALDFIQRNMFINKKNSFGKTPLMLAAQKGLDIIVKALLENGAELDIGVSWSRPYETALYKAIVARRQSIVTMLVSAGAKTSFEFTKKPGNKTAIFSLVDLARDFGMNLTPPSKEQYLVELFQYVANNILKQNPKCSTITQWLREHNYKLESFFLACALIKYGRLNENSYKKVVNTFKEQHRVELEETYRHRFLSYSKITEAGILFDQTIKGVETNTQILKR